MSKFGHVFTESRLEEFCDETLRLDLDLCQPTSDLSLLLPIDTTLCQLTSDLTWYQLWQGLRLWRLDLHLSHLSDKTWHGARWSRIRHSTIKPRASVWPLKHVSTVENSNSGAQQMKKQTNFREMFHNRVVGLQIMFHRLSCHGDWTCEMFRERLFGSVLFCLPLASLFLSPGLAWFVWAWLTQSLTGT